MACPAKEVKPEITQKRKRMVDRSAQCRHIQLSCQPAADPGVPSLGGLVLFRAWPRRASELAHAGDSAPTGVSKPAGSDRITMNRDHSKSRRLDIVSRHDATRLVTGQHASGLPTILQSRFRRIAAVRRRPRQFRGHPRPNSL